MVKASLALSARKPKTLRLFLDLTVFVFLDFTNFLTMLYLLLNLLPILLPVFNLALSGLLKVCRIFLSIKFNGIVFLLKS